MWYFQLIADENRKFMILPGKDYILGRRDCDIVIENDQSVSRKHAILSVSHPDANVTNVNNPATLTLKDLSKFGTFVNNQKVTGDKVLQNGDEIRFGTPKSAHRVVYKPFVVATSCVDGQGKKEVRSLARQIGGHVSNDWRKDCSFLVMKTVTVTIKVVCALVSQTPIVTVDYLRDYVKYLKNGQSAGKPKVEDYLPPVGVNESIIAPGVSFHPAVERSSVFLETSFYFLCEKQFNKMSLAVELGGGVPILCDDPKTADLDGFLEAKTVVMNPGPGEAVTKPQKDWTEKVRVFLQKKGKHLIQEPEVGFAVLYCSTDNYCNADKEVSHLLPTPLASQSLNTQAPSLASQAVSGDSVQASQQPHFRKPQTTVASSRNTAATSKNARKQETLSEGKEEAGVPSSKVKSEDVFTVPGSLSEDTVKTEVQREGRSAFVKEEPADVSESLFTLASGSGESRARASGSSRSEHLAVHSAPLVPSEGSTSSLTRHEALAETPSSTRLQTRSRSPAKSEFVCDTTMSVMTEGKERPAVKVEDGTASRDNLAPSFTSDVLLDSSAPALKKERKGDHKPFSFLDDEDDEEDVVMVRKPAPARKKRGIQEVSSDEDEVNPFDFPKKTSASSTAVSCQGKRTRSPSPAPETTGSKHSKRSPSPKQTRSSSPGPQARKERHPEPTKSPSPPPEARGSRRGKRSPSPRPAKSPSPAPESRSMRHSKRSPSPPPEARGSRRGKRSPSPCPAKSPSPAPESRSMRHSKRSPSPGSQSVTGSAGGSKSHNRGDGDSSHAKDTNPASSSTSHKCTKPSERSEAGIADDRPVPRGFLTTHLPIEDQVEVNSKFEKENISGPAVIVEFEDLVAKPVRTSRQHREDQSDVPAGMMRWEGKLVPNFKKFSKVRPGGAARLPRIIGGRDLEEHCGASKKMMDNWLKEMVEAENDQSQKDKEAEKLFNWQPTSWAKRSKR